MKKFPLVTDAEWLRTWKQVKDLKNLTSSLYTREDLHDDPMDDDLMIYLPDEDIPT